MVPCEQEFVRRYTADYMWLIYGIELNTTPHELVKLLAIKEGQQER